MSKTIYTSKAASIYQKTTEQQTIEETIKEIREGTHEKIIRRIRALKNDDEREILMKNSLPVFFPSVRLSAEGRLGEGSDLTGIVQFSANKDHNQNLDFAILKHQIMEHPACLYVFMSPANELKFGIFTDFVGITGETSETLHRRFAKAYRVCMQQMREICNVRFFDDGDMARIRRSCFFSHDPNAFFNTACTPLIVNDQCQVTFLLPIVPMIHASSDELTVKFALNHIPKILKHVDRIEVNDCVIGMLGTTGISLLMDHWQTEDQLELSKELEGCLKNPKDGNIDLLLSYAEKHGWKRPVSGKGRRNIRPQPCDVQLDPLATVDEATAQLQSIVHDFVTGSDSHFVNVTAGAGKTQTVLEALSREVNHNTNVLFLVPTNNLAAQIVQNYKKIRLRDIAEVDDLHIKTRKATIMQLHSRKNLCENKEAKETLEDKGVSIPLPYCLSKCVLQGNCNYTAQFNDIANIRVMTHHEWKGEQSAWFNGNTSTNSGTEPNGKRYPWVPNFIVVDEDVLKIGKPERELITSSFTSVRLIIECVRKGISLKDAVWAHYEQVLMDGAVNARSKLPSPNLSPEEYFVAHQEKKATSTYSTVVAQLEKFCLYDESSFLDGMWIGKCAGKIDETDEDSDIEYAAHDESDKTKVPAPYVDAIIWLKLPAVADRHHDIPVLYLDATANRAVVHRLLPSVKFHQIVVRQNENVRLFQLSNATFTKSYLKKYQNLKSVTDGLKKIVMQYRKVGLITYKKIGLNEDFAATLAKEIGTKIFTHFGNLRGVNDFEELDCLLIVGRYMLPYNTIRDHASAIFGVNAEWTNPYVERAIRMKDGTTSVLSTRIANNASHLAVYEHSSLSETLQAIGRGRPIHGCKKDIYVFSNENLTTNTEVFELFPFENYFEWPQIEIRRRAPMISQVALDQVRFRGYVHYIEGDLVKQLGLTKGQVKPKANKDRIYEELIAAGASKLDLWVRYANGNKIRRPYFIFGDTQKLEQALLEKNESLVME